MADQSISTISLARLDITVYAGDTYSMVMKFFNDDISTPQDNPMDLRPFDWKMQIKKAQLQNAVLTLSLGSGLTIGGVAFNEMTLEKIINIKGAKYFYDLQATLIADPTQIISYVGGYFIVSQDTTDSTKEV